MMEKESHDWVSIILAIGIVAVLIIAAWKS
jgi:hypothetical protein